jgi:hypothetical protein
MDKNFLGDKRSIVWLLIATVFTACNSGNQQPAGQQKTSAAAKPALMQPFRFHKTIEVSPDNIFDVFSWGRGSNKTGAYLILESDSTGAKYTTTTGDLDGAITDVYNTDMDMDGNPEILIQTKAKDSSQHTQLDVFEYKDNRAQKLDFPRLTSSQKKGYRGEDEFYIKDGGLMRAFPVYDGSGADAKPTGEKRTLAYGIRNNSFTVKTVEAADEKTATASAASDSTKKTSVVPASAPVKTSARNTSQKKHRRVTERRSHSSKKTSRKSSSNHSSKKHRRHRS